MITLLAAMSISTLALLALSLVGAIRALNEERAESKRLRAEVEQLRAEVERLSTCLDDMYENGVHEHRLWKEIIKVLMQAPVSQMGEMAAKARRVWVEDSPYAFFHYTVEDAPLPPPPPPPLND